MNITKQIKKLAKFDKDRLQAAVGYRVPVMSSCATKGGVGKSLFNCKDAEYAALQLGLRVAYVDMDFQANGIELWFGMDAIERNEAGEKLVPANPEYQEQQKVYGSLVNERSSIFDLWEGKRPTPYRTPLSKPGIYEGCVDLFPCDQRLFMKVEGLLEGDSRQANIFYQFVQEELSKDYDLVILDTGPTRSRISDVAVQALTHATLVVIPEVCSDSFLEELVGRMDQENLRRGNLRHPIQFLGFTVNRLERNSAMHAQRVDKIAANWGEEMILPIITKKNWLGGEKAFTDPLKSFRMFKERGPKKLQELRKEWLPYMEQVFGTIFGVEV